MSQHQDKEAEYQRVAVVTGSSSGIGKETSLTLAKNNLAKNLKRVVFLKDMPTMKFLLGLNID